MSTTPVKDGKEHTGHILEMNANSRVDRECSAGDIVACVGLKNTQTGDTLCDGTSPSSSKVHQFASVLDVAVEPKTKAEQENVRWSRQAPAEGRDLPRTHRRGDRPDHHCRRASFTLECRPTACREFKGRLQRGQAAGRLPRTRWPRRAGTPRQVRPASPGVRPICLRCVDAWKSPTARRQKGYEFVNAVGGVVPKYIPSIDKIIEGGTEAASSPALPRGRHQGDPRRRLLPRVDSPGPPSR